MTTIVYANSGFTGAPVLNRQPGSLQALLNAILVDGYNVLTPTSIVVAGEVATVATPTPHGYNAIQVLEVRGSSSVDLNKRFKPLAFPTSSTVTFSAPGVADGTYTGSATIRAASADWERTFQTGFVSVYRSKNLLGTRLSLVVDDSALNWTTVSGAEVVLDATSVVDPWGQGFWMKSGIANDTAQGWQLIADDRTIYFNAPDGYRESTIHGFGDLESNRPNDPFSCYITNYAVATQNSASNSAANPSMGMAISFSTPASTRYLARAVNGVQRNPLMHLQHTFPVNHFITQAHAVGSGGLTYSGTTNTATSRLVYPDPATNGVVMAPILAIDAGLASYRGKVRGAYCSPQVLQNAFGRADILPGSGVLEGRRVITMDYNTQVANLSNSSLSPYTGGRLLFDLDGPWA